MDETRPLLASRQDILTLVTTFYRKLLADPSISYIFTEVAGIDIETHFPILADFWEMVLFQHDTYRKNAMQLHLELNRQTQLSAEHFTTWLRYFNESVDEHFSGDTAFLAKQRALSIATTMRIKILQQPPKQDAAALPPGDRS